MENCAPACLKRRQKKRASRVALSREKRRSRPIQDRGKTVVYELYKTVNYFFPDLINQLRQIEDCRSHSDYALCEILMAAIALFIFQFLILEPA